MRRMFVRIWSQFKPQQMNNQNPLTTVRGSRLSHDSNWRLLADKPLKKAKKIVVFQLLSSKTMFLVSASFQLLQGNFGSWRGWQTDWLARNISNFCLHSETQPTLGSSWLIQNFSFGDCASFLEMGMHKIHNWDLNHLKSLVGKICYSRYTNYYSPFKFISWVE